MRKLSLKMLGLNVAIFLLGLICSATSLVSYVAAQGLLTPSVISPPAAPATTEKLSPTPLPTPKVESTSEPEANQNEYYRGIFDICMTTGQKSGHPRDQILKACQDVVRMAMEQKWFEQPSRDWKWPLPAGLTHFDQNG